MFACSIILVLVYCSEIKQGFQTRLRLNHNSVVNIEMVVDCFIKENAFFLLIASATLINNTANATPEGKLDHENRRVSIKLHIKRNVSVKKENTKICYPHISS
jgi:hypothetical protein